MINRPLAFRVHVDEQPEVERVVQICVAEQHADRAALWRPHIARGHDSFLQYPCFQPAPDQADQARISDAVLHELEEPVVVETAEEVLQIRLELSTLPENIGFDRLVGLAKLRWRIARDYQELKQELGFADYEGRGWRGFQDHATLCIADYGFLIAEGGAFPPSGPAPTALFMGPALPVDFRPRGAPNPARTARAELDRQYPSASHRRSCQDAPQMPC